MMTRMLLWACFCFLVVGDFSTSDLEAPCKPLESQGDAKVAIFLRGRAALITCGNTQRLAFCSRGKWSSEASCHDGFKVRDRTETISSQHQTVKREKRSPNNGKYREVRRRAKVQRRIRAGLLETRIDADMPTIFRVHPGGNVYLACRIENLGAHSVTWIRIRDNSVLAIDTSVLNGDRRINPIYEDKTETWLLGILGVREFDDGQYECRVSTRHPLKRVVTLQIVPDDQPLHGPFQFEGDHDLDFVLRNITALWEEVHEMRQEINHHLHDDHTEPNHDQILEEIEGLHHEHHVHHLHHPHEGHNAHHDADLLQHLTEVHAHMDDHTEGQAVHGHAHKHGHSHDHHHGNQEEEQQHDGHEHDDDEGHDHHDSHEHDHHDSHEHDHHDSHTGHDHHDSHTGHDHHDSHTGHDHDSHTGQDHLHDAHHQGDHSNNHYHQHHENEDIHDTHGLHSHEEEHEYAIEHADHSDEHHAHDDDHHYEHDHHHEHHQDSEDHWMYATCTLKPNVDEPESNVKGSIIISQKKDKTDRVGVGPVYFDLHVSGIDVANTGRIHGFHVHKNAVTEDSCGSTGGHFNPYEVVHGAPADDVRHVGDLGNVEVDENGELNGYIIADSKVSLLPGQNSIIGKALVLHAGVDDLGTGGDAGSLATGNAGGRLACCSIYWSVETARKLDLSSFRFKG